MFLVEKIQIFLDKTRENIFYLLPFLFIGFLPWAVVVWPTGFYLVFMFGWVDLDPIGINLHIEYLFESGFSLPSYLLAWPISTVLYIGAVSAVVFEFFDRDLHPIIPGLFFLSGIDLLYYALGLSRQQDLFVLPIGIFLLWGAFLYTYRKGTKKN